jgi:hypothetical protein
MTKNFSIVAFGDGLKITGLLQRDEAEDNMISKFHNKITTAGAAPCTRLTFFLSRRKESKQRKRRPWHGACRLRRFL